MSFELPHVEDLETNSKLPGQLTANFKAIEKEDQQDDKTRDEADSDEQEARKTADSKLSDRLDQLDNEKATHSDVNDLREEMYKIRDNWHDRASHIARGTDIETTKAVVEQILQEKGLM